MSYRPKYDDNGVYNDLPVDAQTLAGHSVEETGVSSDTDTLPTTAQVKAYIESNEKYHTPIASSGIKIATGIGVGVTDMYVPTGTNSNTACAGDDARLSDARVPTSHASSTNAYGVGTSDDYGHVKVISGDLNGKSATDGYAASQSHSHSNYQAVLVSGTNIKTINNQSLLGSGNINVGGSGSNLKIHFIHINIYDDEGESVYSNDDYYTFLLPSTTVTSAITNTSTLKTALIDAGASAVDKPIPITQVNVTSDSSGFEAVGMYVSNNKIILTAKDNSWHEITWWNTCNITDTVIG